MSPWKKYLLLQIPGWVITATVVTVLWRWQLFPGWLALLCFLAWLIKDLALYPFVRRAYESSAPTGSAALIGARGVAQGDLNPSGYVRVRGELWLATAVPAGRAVAAGTEVKIIGAERMRLFVSAAD